MYRLLVVLFLLLLTFSLVYNQNQSICDIANCIHGVCILDSQQRDGFRCDCNIGYTGSFCERLCTPRDVGCSVVTQPPMCSPGSCMNGQCSNSSDQGSQCICYEGWTGADCDIDINFCEINGGSTFFGPCNDLGSLLCVDGNNTYSCECVIGFTGNNCESNVNECDLTSNPCSGHGTCIDELFATYSCVCDPGFTGLTCETTIPACDSDPCLNQGTCQNLSGGKFSCNCSSSFTGVLCEVSIQTCASMPCLNGATCRDTPGSNFTCLCQEGFFGTTCSFQNCTAELCKNGGECILNGTNATCECPSRFDGAFCEVDRCENITCLNGGTCIVNNDTMLPICWCRNNFSGPLCEIDSCSHLACSDGAPCISMNNICSCVNNMPCRIGNHSLSNLTCASSNPCLNGGTCSVSDQGLYCDCSPQYQGIHCEIDRCDDIICLNGGICNSSRQNIEPHCHCTENFSGERCEVDSCTNVACPSGGNCMNSNGICTCINGESCIINSTEKCTMETCLNGGSCSISNNALQCQCNDNYGGEFCQDQLCAEDTCPKECSCIEVEGEFGKIPLCNCPITTAGIRPPSDPANPILLVFVILLALVILASFIIGIMLVIFIYGRRKFRRRIKEGHNVTIHAEYHTNAVYLCEDNISVDVDQHHIVNENIRNCDTDGDIEIVTNPMELELKNMNWNDVETGQDSPEKDLEFETTELQNNTVPQNTKEESIAATPTSDFSENGDVNSINLAFVDSDQEQSDLQSSGVFVEANSNYTHANHIPLDASVESMDLERDDLTDAPDGQPNSELVQVNFSFNVGSEYRSHNSSQADLDQNYLPEVIPNDQVVHDTTSISNA